MGRTERKGTDYCRHLYSPFQTAFGFGTCPVVRLQLSLACTELRSRMKPSCGALSTPKPALLPLVPISCAQTMLSPPGYPERCLIAPGTHPASPMHFLQYVSLEWKPTGQGEAHVARISVLWALPGQRSESRVSWEFLVLNSFSWRGDGQDRNSEQASSVHCQHVYAHSEFCWPQWFTRERTLRGEEGSESEQRHFSLLSSGPDPLSRCFA